jgi:hypothetical protein
MNVTSPVMSYGGEKWYMKNDKVDRTVVAVAILCVVFFLWAIYTRQKEGFYLDPNIKEGFYLDPNITEGFYIDPNVTEGFSGSHDNEFGESYLQRNGLPTAYSGIYGYGQNTPRY